MTNKGATVKLTEKQRETLVRLAFYLGHDYVGLSFVRPNTWRSLVAAGLVQESTTERGMFKLTEQGCTAVGVKSTYVSNVRTAEVFAVIEHLRRGNDSAMRTAEAAQLRDSQVLLDPHGKRIAAVGTELVNGRTRLWTVDLDEPDQSPKWIDATPAMMNVVFARAEGWARPLHMRRADSGLLFRVLGSEGTGPDTGVNLVAVSDEAYELFRTLTDLVEDGWIACEHDGVSQERQALRAWVAGANTALAKTVRAVASDEAAAFVDTSSYWVVPIAGQRLTERHDLLGPYATLDLAEWKRDEYIAAGYPCSVLVSVTRPTLVAAPVKAAASFAVGDQVQQLDGTPAMIIAVVDGDMITVRTAEGDLEECRGDELRLIAAAPGVAVPLTLAQYIVNVAATVPTAQRAALLAHS